MSDHKATCNDNLVPCAATERWVNTSRTDVSLYRILSVNRPREANHITTWPNSCGHTVCGSIHPLYITLVYYLLIHCFVECRSDLNTRGWRPSQRVPHYLGVSDALPQELLRSSWSFCVCTAMETGVFFSFSSAPFVPLTEIEQEPQAAACCMSKWY